MQGRAVPCDFVVPVAVVARGDIDTEVEQVCNARSVPDPCKLRQQLAAAGDELTNEVRLIRDDFADRLGVVDCASRDQPLDTGQIDRHSAYSQLLQEISASAANSD